LHQCGRCSSQPERHFQGTVECGGGGQFGTGLVRPADLVVKGTEAAVAVDLERAHAEFIGQREGLLIIVFSLLDTLGLAMCGNFAEEPYGPGFVAPGKSIGIAQ